MAIDRCPTHDLNWDRDYHTECPQCANTRTFSSDLQDASELAWTVMGEVGTGRWVRNDLTCHLWDDADRLAGELVAALQKLQAQCEPDEVKTHEPPPSRPIMGAWNGTSI